MTTSNKSLKKLVIPGSVEVIGEVAFSNYQNIEELIIENGVKRIETCAFANNNITLNKSLEKLTIPPSVETIGEYAFIFYSNLQYILMPKMDNEEEIFAGCNENLKIEYYK